MKRRGQHENALMYFFIILSKFIPDTKFRHNDKQAGCLKRLDSLCSSLVLISSLFLKAHPWDTNLAFLFHMYPVATPLISVSTHLGLRGSPEPAFHLPLHTWPK